MFERKEALINNKKCVISHEYIRKVFESINSHRNFKSNGNNNSDFKKVEIIKKIGISNDQPLVLFHKPNPSNIHSIENKIKKDLIDNNGYLDDGGYKKKLLKFISYHNTDQNLQRNIFRSACSHNKNRSKMNENPNILNSKRTSFSMGLNKRSIRKDYSNSIKKFNKRPNIKHTEEGKEHVKKLFNSISVKKDNKNSLIKRLTNKKNIEKFYASSEFKNSNKKEKDYKRKKEYLKQNGISYNYDTEVENEKNNNNTNANKGHNLKDIKDIKKIDTINDNQIRKKSKKTYKDKIKSLEFLEKIKKEINILRKSKDKDIDKDKGNKLTNKNYL
jgi:hypothetical protein